MYYWAFKILGVEVSNTFPEQRARLDEFLDVTMKTRIVPNVVLLGYFNVNLNGEAENPNLNNATLKDKLLDLLPVEGYT